MVTTEEILLLSLYYRITNSLKSFAHNYHGFLAGSLLTLMFGLGIGSMMSDSAIVDELAHIPAAYSYVHYGDYRLNPEHPPLIKDMAGIPLQFMNLKFPDTIPAWTTDPNGQWEMGWNFLYHIGNNANQILFWARLPILLLAIVFGGLFYWFLLKRYGRAVALLSLFFYTLSPNILAHSRLVTTDLGATVFIFIALVAYALYAKKPTKTMFWLLALALGVAQLAKFSAVLLYPFLLIASLILASSMKRPKTYSERFRTYTGGLILASIVSIGLVWLYYIPQTMNMPIGIQDNLITASLVSPGTISVGNMLKSFNHLPLMESLSQYLLGLTMVFGRVAGGNVTYFNGTVSDQSFHLYFPEIFILKTQVSFLILGFITSLIAIWGFATRLPKRIQDRFADSFRRYILEWILGGFAAFYFIISVAGNLNLGIRHILPIYAPLFVLVALGTVHLARRLARTKWHVYSGLILTCLLLWYGLSTIIAYPSYISYFNELIGGPGHSEQYFSDSGVDWGQDLRRLKTFVTQHPEINHIAIDYFGGADPRYYFCKRAYDPSGALIATSEGYNCTDSFMEEWHSQNGRYQGEFIAVSETFLENDKYYSGLRGEEGYQYLRNMKPYARVGDSIFVYKLY